MALRSAGEPIYVGVLLVDVDTGWVRSLKEKRSLIKPVTERLKARHPVSVARLDGLDEHAWERIGVVSISADPVWLRHTLERALAAVRAGGLSVSASRIDIERWEG